MNAPRVTAPTMSDVAGRAGVSTMTVSRALRNGASIARETRERIMLAVEELGYVLDQSAGSLSSKRTGFVAALVPSLNYSNFAGTARGLTDALQGSGLQLLLGYTDYSVEKEAGLIESMLLRRPEAIVVTGGSHTPRGRKGNLGASSSWTRLQAHCVYRRHNQPPHAWRRQAGRL